MPKRVARMIEEESPRNKHAGMVTALASMLECDPGLDWAYLCRDTVVQISKLHGEGNHFCAYRNIQMLLPRPYPVASIPELQEMIEKAWDEGFNPHSRIETGGIKGTRKHIGTPEVSKYFCHEIELISLHRLRHYFPVSRCPLRRRPFRPGKGF